MPIQVCIFLGYHQNKQIQMHLNQNAEWKKLKVLNELNLKETVWQDKAYIGHFLPFFSTYPQLKEKELEIKTLLQVYCPKINLDKHSIYLFPQIFLC